jgi:hypothetical protein
MKLEQQPQFSIGDFVRLKGQKDSPTMVVERNFVSRFYGTLKKISLNQRNLKKQYLKK